MLTFVISWHFVYLSFLDSRHASLRSSFVLFTAVMHVKIRLIIARVKLLVYSDLLFEGGYCSVSPLNRSIRRRFFENICHFCQAVFKYFCFFFFFNQWFANLSNDSFYKNQIGNLKLNLF